MLSPEFPPQEINSLFEIAIEHSLHLSKIEIHKSLDKNITLRDEKNILSILTRLSQAEPIQYILGYASFYDLQIKVNPNVLIPRSETEYLVERILHDQKDNPSLKIIDLCTGSGCIALALAKNLYQSQVFAMEYSKEALRVAKQNALNNKLDVHFVHDNLLSPEKSFPKFNLLVSNPPYVRESEKKLMHKNVLNFEPEIALFVPDADPLKFYSAISKFAVSYLAKAGHIYLEINEALGAECKELFESAGYKNVRILKDLENRDRYLHATK